MSTTPTHHKRMLIGVAMLLILAFGVVTLGPSSRAAAPTRVTPKAFTLTSMSPPQGAVVDYRAPLRLEFSTAIDPKGPMPTVEPSSGGSWAQLSPNVIEYVPTAPFTPGKTIFVTIPFGAHGMESAAHVRLDRAPSLDFQTAPLATLEAQKLLAQLGYLPFTYSEVTQAFTPRWAATPDQLTSQWVPGQDNVLTKGAVMTFEDVHDMATDGVVGPAVASRLVADAAANKMDPNPYNYVLVSQAQPESLELFSNGQVTYRATVNTGIPGSTTNVGTFPVYLRYQSQTMSGTNPDGSHYSDPGIPWVSYFSGGDALHGFLRASYGFPQSLGCVEMPYDVAGQLWPHTPIGTLVTVEPEG